MFHAVRDLDIFFFALAVVEGLFFTFILPQKYDWKLFLSGVGFKAIRILIGTIASVVIFVPIAMWVYQHRLFTIELSSPLSFLGLFLTVEFIYYVRHLILHRGIFWITHSAHHSPRDLNYAVAGVLSWESSTFLFGAYFVLLPAFWLGFEPLYFIAAFGVDVILQTWFHTTRIKKLGWLLESVLNTPSHHRVHHAKNPEYLGANYGALLIIFDRIFGTFVPEDDKIKIEYGLPGWEGSYNPVTVLLHPWKNFFRNLMRVRSPSDLWQCLAGNPD